MRGRVKLKGLASCVFRLRFRSGSRENSRSDYFMLCYNCVGHPCVQGGGLGMHGAQRHFLRSTTVSDTSLPARCVMETVSILRSADT